MKKFSKMISLFVCMVLCVSLLAAPVGAASSGSASAANDSPLSYFAGVGTDQPTQVAMQKIGNSYYLFLPSSADFGALSLSFPGDYAAVAVGSKSLYIKSGEAFDFASLYSAEPADGVYKAYFVISGSTYEVNVMRSAALRSLYITSADPEKVHDYVDAVKGNKAKGNGIVLLDADGGTIYDGVMKEIKGRGNSTWHYPKKPYQFKLNEKFDLLGMGEEEAAKTWILLANYADSSLFRNSLTNDLAAAIGLRYTHNSEFVDLYYDGKYCGCYLLSEKCEIDDARVDINDLEGDIEDANGEDVDFDDFATAIVKNSCGNDMQVVEGVALPEDISGGYLLELDYEVRAKAEKSWFNTSNGQYIVAKSPEYLPAEAMEYISGLYQLFEDAVYNGGTHPETGKDYTEYMDLETLAKSYLLLTLSQNGDAFLSSTYFYIPQNEYKLYAGPVWDFDTAYGLYYGSDELGLVPARSGMVMKLLQIESFRGAVAKEWNDCLKAIVGETVLSRDAVSASGVGSIAAYAGEVRRSRMMDAVVWNHSEEHSVSVEKMYSFMAESYEWVDGVLTDPNTLWSDSGFVDVDVSSWYHDAVVYTTGKKYFSGISDVLFNPNGDMTRGMLVAVLHRVAGCPKMEGDCTYTDISANSPFRQAVIWADSIGLTTGYGNGCFGANDPITREQMVVFLHRFAECRGIELTSAEISDSFADKSDIAPWAAEAFGWAIGEGIINGVGGEQLSLSPQASATRAMTATVIHRYDTGILNQ